MPSDWYELSKLTNLVSQLQMLGAKENLQQKYTDLKYIVLNIMAFFVTNISIFHVKIKAKLYK